MSGAEAITAIQLIDACIGITQTIISISLAVKDAQGLPPKLWELCEKLPAIEELLESAHDSVKEGRVTEENSKSARPILQQCEHALSELRDIFRRACPRDDDDWKKRTWRGARTVFIGRDSQVQKLLKIVQDSLGLLEQKEVFRIGEKLDELKQITEALAQDDDGRITHTGSGNVLANQGGTHVNYLMSGSGRQINNPGVYHEGPTNHTHNYYQTKDAITRVQEWLAPPDPHSNLRKSLKLRSPGTGQWYLQSAQYGSWKAGKATSTWLYGSAGSGKTIFSAGIIEDLQEHCNSDPTRSLAFFLFDFDDAEKRNPVNMIKSLLNQLIPSCARVPDPVLTLRSTCENGRREPSEEQLLEALKITLEVLPASFIVLDALDECDDWDVLFDMLLEFQRWNKSTVHILVTSRMEIVIRQTLEDIVLPDNRICLESHLIDKDIETYVRERLIVDKSFKRWQGDLEVQEEIKRTFGNKARGMFRWAACQLDTLAKCVTRGKVLRALKELPKTLDETYARILHTIENSEHAEEALQILTWLTYAGRLLTATEVLQTTGILIEGESRFDKDEVLEDPSDILRICSSLVSVVTGSEGSNGIGHDDDETTTQILYDELNERSTVTHVRLAHFSVKEYLVSNRPSIARYRLSSQEPHDKLAKCCLVYLLRFQEEQWTDRDCEVAFPLARYAAGYWTRHARASGIISKQQEDLTIQLFTEKPRAFCAWVSLYDMRTMWSWSCYSHRETSELPTPLFAASKEGIAHAVRAILRTECADIDAQWADEGNALQASSLEDFETIAEMLLARGANADVKGGPFGSALYASLMRGHDKIVEMLLDKGADANTRGGRDITPEGYDSSVLYLASSLGNKKIVEMLLAKGADVNAQGGQDGSALQTALSRGYDEIVEMLLAQGADANAQGGEDGSALQTALARGYVKIAEMLLAKGADVNAPGGFHGNALYASSSRGYDKIVEMIIAKGADVNAQGGHHSSAISAALTRGHDEIVKMLLHAGAQVNAKGGYHGSILCAASFRGNEKVVEMLLANGADIHAQGSYRGSALQTAATQGHDRIVQMLLARGADVNARAGHHGSALYAASTRGYEKIVRMLVDAGADVNALERRFGNVLHAASERGHHDVVQLLIDAGANVNADSNASITYGGRHPRDGDINSSGVEIEDK